MDPRTPTLAAALALATAAFALVPTAEAGCMYNIGPGICNGGSCYYNIASNCYTGGNCTYNVGGTCSGSCYYNVAATCKEGANCTHNVGSTCSQVIIGCTVVCPPEDPLGLLCGTLIVCDGVASRQDGAGATHPAAILLP